MRASKPEAFISSELQEIDLYTLSEPQSLRFIVRDGLFEESFLSCLKSDCDRIIGPIDDLSSPFEQHTLLRRASFGQVMSASDASVRGDYTVWLTPDLCAELSLQTIPKYIQRIIRLIKPLKDELALNEDYSAQLAVYVSNRR